MVLHIYLNNKWAGRPNGKIKFMKLKLKFYTNALVFDLMMVITTEKDFRAICYINMVLRQKSKNNVTLLQGPQRVGKNRGKVGTFFVPSFSGKKEIAVFWSGKSRGICLTGYKYTTSTFLYSSFIT